MLKHKRKILKIFVIAFIAINVVAFFHAYKFTHFSTSAKARTSDPNKLSTGEKIRTIFFGVNNPRPVDKEKPARDFKTIRIKLNSDTLECWCVPVDSAKATVILFHGYAGNKSMMVGRSDALNQLGYNTVLVDFTGSGGSTGNKTTVGYYESGEVKAVYDYFQKEDSSVILFGTSMGAVAILKSISDYHIKPRSVILECPFGNMLKTVQARFKIMHAPAFPMSYLLVFWGGVQNGFNAYKHNPCEYSKQVNVPALLIYGSMDNKVSREETDCIFKNLSGEKELKVYENAGHENLFDSDEGRWIMNIGNFIQ